MKLIPKINNRNAKYLPHIQLCSLIAWHIPIEKATWWKKQHSIYTCTLFFRKKISFTEKISKLNNRSIQKIMLYNLTTYFKLFWWSVIHMKILFIICFSTDVFFSIVSIVSSPIFTIFSNLYLNYNYQEKITIFINCS